MSTAPPGPASSLDGLDVLLQLGAAVDHAGVRCTAFRGIAVPQPARLLVVWEGAPETQGWASDLRDGLASLLQGLAASATEAMPPCRGGYPPFECMATGDANVRNVLVWVGSSPPSAGGSALVSDWLDRGERFDAIAAAPAGTDVDAALPPRLLRKQAVTWRADPAEVAPAILSFAGVTPAENRVFVSYRHGEGDALANELFHLLSEARFDVFLDRFSLDPGTDWVERLEDELADKAFVLVVETPNVADSRWIRREIDFAKKHRLGLASIEQGGRAAGIEDGRRLHLAESDWLAAPQPLPSGRPSYLTPKAANEVVAFVLERHARALVWRRRLLDRALRLALSSRGVPTGILRKAAGGIDVAGTTGCSIDLTVRPPRLVDFHAVDRRAAALGSKPLLVGPRAAGAVRRETVAWLVGRTGVTHYDEGRLLELAQKIADGDCA